MRLGDYMGPGGTFYPPTPSTLFDIAQAIRDATANVYGSSSYSPTANIRNIQAALNTLPTILARLSVDGNLGPKTRTRIAEFQRQNGLTATGELDNTTASRILGATAFSGATASGGVSSGNNTANRNTTPPPPPPSAGISTTTLLIIAGVFAVVWLSD